MRQSLGVGTVTMNTQALENAKATDQIFIQYDRTWEQFKHIQKALEGTPRSFNINDYYSRQLTQALLK